MPRNYYPNTDPLPTKLKTYSCGQSGWAPWTQNGLQTINAFTGTRMRRKQNVKTALALNGYLSPLAFYGEFQTAELTLGEIATSWDQYGTKVTSLSKDYHYVLNHGVWLGGGSWVSLRDQALALASARLIAKVRDQRLSTIETVYEGRKTAKQILDTLRTLTKAARSVKQGRIAEAAKTLGLATPPKTLLPKRYGRLNYTRKERFSISPARTSKEFADRWLAFRYGWIPLYSTVYGSMTLAYDACKAANNNRYHHVTVKPDAVFQSVSTRTSGAFGLYGSRLSGYCNQCLADMRYQSTETIRITASQTAVIRLSNPNLSFASQMGLTNPLLVAWELVPFSFVADWFVNVSDVLEQLDAWVGKDYVTGSYTWKREAVALSRSYVASVPNTSPYTVVLKKAAAGKIIQTRVERVVVNQPPVVSLSFSIGLGPKRIADAVALFRQVVLSRKQ